MATLLTELLHDAAQRAGDIADTLGSITLNASSAVEAYRSRMAGMARQARQLIDRMLADPDIEDANFANNYFRDYCYFARLIRGLEDLPLLVLKRFTASDQQATDLVAAICRESNFPFTPPICSAISSQYFWTMPDMDLVFVPCLEPDHILGLPDIYHELGHMLLFREKNRLEHPALTIVDEHYDRLLAEARKNWPGASLDQIEQYRHNWRRSWLLEFSADLIASYLVGPSFGWCNIRTATNLGGELFVGNDSHPADDARATAIGMMLTVIGCDTERHQIESRWQELITLAEEKAPHRYELAYPRELLKDLTEFFDRGCEALGLIQYEPDRTDGRNIVTTINDCWTRFRQSPEDYAAYERSRIPTLLSPA